MIIEAEHRIKGHIRAYHWTLIRIDTQCLLTLTDEGLLRRIDRLMRVAVISHFTPPIRYRV